MPIVLERNQGLQQQSDEELGLECPYCSVYAHLTPQSIPDVTELLKNKPKHIGLV